MFGCRRTLLRWTPSARQRHRCYTAAHGSARLVEHDSVVLESKKGNAPVFIQRLESGGRSEALRIKIHHDDVIGRQFGDVVYSHPGPASKKAPLAYILQKAKLDQYITGSRRLVTPLYPQDARLIVELLDFHPDTFGSVPATDENQLDILEAGTGHGALTLYLSRAIHAANPPLPAHAVQEEEIAAWKSARRAVIHSVELVRKHSEHAEGVVRGFRHGMYHRNVDFYVDDVSEWCRRRMSERADQSPFLSRAFMDLPSTENHMQAVADALRVDGVLVVFNPSITQILDCFRRVKEERMDLWLDKVIELGTNGGSGGREWDVRAVIPRAEQRASIDSATSADSDMSDSNQDEPLTDGAIPVQLENDKALEGGWQRLKMVCRPKIGGLVYGGGFLAVFRKRQPSTVCD